MILNLNMSSDINTPKRIKPVTLIIHMSHFLSE